MGLRIGTIANTLSAEQITVHADTPARSRDETAQKLRTESRGKEVEITAGFGENTISIPGLAARTIGSNMSNARKMVPTLEELRQEQQERVEERRAEAREELEARLRELEENAREPVVRIEFQRAESEARAQARAFTDAGNEEPREPRPLTEGQEPQVQNRQASLEVGERAFTFTAPASAEFDLQG
ncbi:MAG: hypothetical protein R6V12_16950 [Candidatus Hydrogenedentota bacterium]